MGVANVASLLYIQRPEKLNEKPSVLPAVEVIAPGGSYNPDFFSHQVTCTSSAITDLAMSEEILESF